MNNARLSFSALVFALSLLGCTTMHITSLSDHSLPVAGHWMEVDVYENASDLPGPYHEVAILEITSAVSMEALLRDSRLRAAELGGDGIVVERTGTHTEMTPLWIGYSFIPLDDERWDGRIRVIRMN